MLNKGLWRWICSLVVVLGIMQSLVCASLDEAGESLCAKPLQSWKNAPPSLWFQMNQAAHARNGMSHVPTNELDFLLKRIPILRADPDRLKESLIQAFDIRYPLSLSNPLTQATQSFKIFILSEFEHAVAVLKVFKKPRSVLHEIAALEILRSRNLKKGQISSILGLYNLQAIALPSAADHWGQLLITSFAGADLESQMKYIAEESTPLRVELLRGPIQAVARALGEIHEKFKRSNIHTKHPDVAYFFDYEINRMRQLGAKILLSDLVKERTKMTSTQIQDLVSKFGLSAFRYKKWGPQWISAYHGDAHPANFSYDRGLDQVTLFDLQDFLWSIHSDAKGIYGSVDALADVGRFLMSLSVCGFQYGLNVDEVRQLRTFFLEAYPRKITTQAEKAALEFFEYRMAAVVLAGSQKTPDFVLPQLAQYLLSPVQSY